MFTVIDCEKYFSYMSFQMWQTQLFLCIRFSSFFLLLGFENETYSFVTFNELTGSYFNFSLAVELVFSSTSKEHFQTF